MRRKVLGATRKALAGCLVEPPSEPQCPVPTSIEERSGVNETIVSLAHLPSDTACSGILLTTNGMILTAYHVVERWERDWMRLKEMGPGGENFTSWARESDKYKATGRDLRHHSIDTTFWVADPGHDLAIVHAVMPVEARPTGLRANLGEMEGDSMSFSFAGCVFGSYPGVLHSASSDLRFRDGKTVSDAFILLGKSCYGFSGGPIYGRSGKLQGVHIAGGILRPDRDLAVGVKLKYARELVLRADAELAQLERE